MFECDSQMLLLYNIIHSSQFIINFERSYLKFAEKFLCVHPFQTEPPDQVFAVVM